MQCIIFTDTNRLAEKYGVSRQEVYELIAANLFREKEVEFSLLDAWDYADELGSSPSWREYKAILIDYMRGMGISPSPSLSLFVVGGEDVIPMPRQKSPLDDTPLQVDFLYCFEDSVLKYINADKAMCHIGRLPMENGRMTTGLRDDLQSYFNLIHMFLTDGIDVDKVVMTSTQSWLPASNEMVKGLPIVKPRYISGATLDNMYTSPSLALNDSQALPQYKEEIGQADMLVFNLHGTDVPGHPSFYGEGAQGHDTPETFHPDLLQHSGARIFNTVACFGGRYAGYNRKDSMLLSAIYGGGVLLYSGSCVSALGRSGQQHVAARDMLIPAGMSESFMKLYMLYLFRGISAGEAFLRAKCDYFNTCRSLDGDDAALATIFMFNLYGLPALHVVPREDVTQEARGVKNILPVQELGPMSCKSVFVRSKGDGASLSSEVRSLVDANLNTIRKTIEVNLYRYWGLEPEELNRIDEIYQGSSTKGYRFEYLSNDSLIQRKTWAYVDSLGQVQDVVHFK